MVKASTSVYIYTSPHLIEMSSWLDLMVERLVFLMKEKEYMHRGSYLPYPDQLVMALLIKNISLQSPNFPTSNETSSN